MLPENELLSVIKKLFADHLDKEKGYFIVLFPFRRPDEGPDAKGAYHCIASGTHPELPEVLERCARGAQMALKEHAERLKWEQDDEPETH